MTRLLLNLLLVMSFLLFVFFYKLFINPSSFLFLVLFIGRAVLSPPRGAGASLYVRSSFRAARVSSGGVGSNKNQFIDKLNHLLQSWSLT